MKKFIPFLAVLLFSCSANDSKILSTQINPVAWVLAPDSTHNIQVYDTLYAVQMSQAEKIQLEKSRGELWWFAFGILLLAATIVLFIIRQNRGDDGPSAVIILCIFIAGCGCVIGGSTEWVQANDEQQISKPYYDSLMKKDGNLHAFWNSVAH